MPFQRVVAAGLGIHKLGSQILDLMQYFLPRGIQSPSQCRVDAIQCGDERVQFAIDGVAHLVEDFHSLDGGYRFPAEKVTTAKNVQKIDLIFLESSGDAAFEDRCADSRKYRWCPAVQSFI